MRTFGPTRLVGSAGSLEPEMSVQAHERPSAEQGHRPAPTARPRAGWRAVALPSEHGGWGLTLEPVLLGLIVAFSGAGVAIGLVALLAFLARTPVKTVLVDRWRHRWLSRTRLAAIIAAAELTLLVALLVIAALTADGAFWVPLVLALPLMGVELWFDMRSRGRQLVPELAGSIGIAAVASAIVVAGGMDAATAAGVWLVLAARALASLPFVRFQIRRLRDQPHRLWPQDLAQVAAIAAAAAGVVLGWLPWGALVPVAAIAAVQVVLARTPPRPAKVVGMQQMVLGLAVTISAGIIINLAQPLG